MSQSPTSPNRRLPSYPVEGVIPLQDILGAVRATGWDGVLSVDLFREEYWQHDPLAVAREAKAKTLAVLERVLRGGEERMAEVE
jgi:sugar phosphate isomerase/epimerase